MSDSNVNEAPRPPRDPRGGSDLPRLRDINLNEFRDVVVLALERIVSELLRDPLYDPEGLYGELVSVAEVVRAHWVLEGLHERRRERRRPR